MTTTSSETEQTQKNTVYDGPHETMGQYLQRARIEQDRTLDSVAEATCIHIATIKALEEDDYEKLPAEVFVRGFIKIYATLLNLDPDKALSLYQPVPGVDNDFTGKKGPKKRILPGETLAEASPFTAGRQLLIFLLIASIALLTYKVFLSTPQPEVITTIAETTSETTTITEANQHDLITEPATVESVNEAEPSLPAPETKKTESDIAEVPAQASQQPSVTPEPVEEPATTVVPAVVTPEEATQPPTEELSSVTQPAAHQERIIIEPHRRKTIRKVQQDAATAEAPSDATDSSQAPTAEEMTLSTIPLPEKPVAQATPPLLDSSGTGLVAETKTKTDAKQAPFVYVLKAVFSDLTWLEVVVDNGPQRDYTFRAGEQWEWQANEEIKLHVGNAGGVKLRLNNKTLPPLGETGKSVRITLPTEPR